MLRTFGSSSFHGAFADSQEKLYIFPLPLIVRVPVAASKRQRRFSPQRSSSKIGPSGGASVEGAGSDGFSEGAGGGVVWVSGAASVWGSGGASVWGSGGASVWGSGGASVWGSGGASVWGAGGATVWGSGGATVWGSGGASVWCSGGATVGVSGCGSVCGAGGASVGSGLPDSVEGTSGGSTGSVCMRASLSSRAAADSSPAEGSVSAVSIRCVRSVCSPVGRSLPSSGLLRRIIRMAPPSRAIASVPASSLPPRPASIGFAAWIATVPAPNAFVMPAAKACPSERGV